MIGNRNHQKLAMAEQKGIESPGMKFHFMIFFVFFLLSVSIIQYQHASTLIIFVCIYTFVGCEFAILAGFLLQTFGLWCSDPYNFAFISFFRQYFTGFCL